MNLFDKYGIKQVADVTFYSIEQIGDEEIYTPVLYLDSLKLSTLEKTNERVTAKGGKGNKKLISWDFGKEIKLNIEDALFSPASMSMIWGGKLNSKLSPYTSAIVKINMANKYGKLNYSIKAYPSPALTDEEWDIVFKAATDSQLRVGPDDNNSIYWEEFYNKDTEYIEQNRTELRKRYLKRLWYSTYPQDLKDAAPIELMPEQYGDMEEKDGWNEWLNNQQAMPDIIVNKILSYIDELKKIGTIETQICDIESIDRFEKCIVKNKEGLIISTSEQKANLLKYYQNDKTSSYVIYYDARTMLPLLNLNEDGMIQGWDCESPFDSNYDKDFDGKADQDEFKLKMGTIYYKWSRTVKKSENIESSLGKTFIIDSDTFPGVYKITGETSIREQKTQRDIRYKFTIFRASVSSDTNITLEADGDPTVFNMSIDVLVPPNEIQMELKAFDVEEDRVHGGTRILPQSPKYTPTLVDQVVKKEIDIDNDVYY